ncbi:ATP-dependent Clp protease ATP-binding subunit [Kutzneria sp. CA-103260]|uniref:ATP-dependent Clp protease ATP-binding subunit n=1 Tax=Kutzneria sp. CA-103260 TaxID=2802641 RepID=UPI001BA50512|nr:ATP-dependent Clp protease ATP-binding subunit [Kutzneria sp. CA-103260]QUQ72587.1 Clp amino terminal domain, pathogenicity island component [Kutzneria sp. CA-103260]
MPKINVYLSDELADAVRESGVPVSAICQRALETSVKRVTAIREATIGDLDGDPTGKLPHFTERARVTVKLAIEQARADGSALVGTEHLLHGIVREGSNMALRVLEATEVDPKKLLAELPAPAGGEQPADKFSGPLANAFELAVTEAITMGHNYIGCEHLLLGLVAEQDGAGGQALRAAGAELRSLRGAVSAALAGFVHQREQSSKAAGDPAAAVAALVGKQLKPLLDRLDRLERHVGLE